MPLLEVLLSETLKDASVLLPTVENPKKVKVALDESPETELVSTFPSKKMSNDWFLSLAFTVTLPLLSVKAEAGEAVESEYSPMADRTDNPRASRVDKLDMEI
jgi:hypothetical protein